MESKSLSARSHWQWSVRSSVLMLAILVLSVLPFVSLQADDLAPPPVAPTNLVATAASPTQINLTWDDNSTTETSFRIERNTVDHHPTYVEIATVAADETSFSDTGVDCDKTYYYRVRAYRSGDTKYSGYSNVANTTTHACPPPDAPSSLNATAASQTQIDLTWTDNSDDEDNFRIERSPNGTDSWGEIGTAAADATGYSDATLLCSTTYYYRVRAYRSSDALYSEYSNVADDTTDPCPPPAAPTSLNASAFSPTQIDLDWVDNSGDETSFRIERSPNGTSGWAEIDSVGAGVTAYNDTGLSCETTYYYRVRAHRSGDGQYSGYSNVADDATGACPPDAPSSLTATAVSDSQIDLSWQDNSSDETAFYIDRSPDGSTWSPLTSVGADVTTYNDGGLDCGTDYYYRVRSFRSSDSQYSSYSNTAHDATDACPPPDAPSLLNATAFSPARIDLDWQDNSSDETSFRIERSPDGTSGWTETGSVGADATTFSDTGLSCETTYYYRVRAYRDSDAQFSGYSNEADATTADCLSFYLPFIATDVDPVPPEPPVEECEDLIKNGGFESTSDWEIPTTVHTASYSTGQAHSGSRSMRIGIVDPGSNDYSYSSARQVVTIPADATSAKLRFWLYPRSGEASALASAALAPARPLARTVEEATLSDDAQYVLVLNEAGTWIDTLLWQKRDDGEWMYHEIDMLPDWAGKTIKLHFGVFNDGEDGVTAMNVDDVELEVCTGGAPPSDCYPKLDDTVAVGDAPHGVAVNSVNDRLYVANHVGDSLTVIDSTDYTKIRTTAVGNGPNGVAYNPTNNRVYVALRNSNRVKVLRANGSEILKTIDVGSQPNGVAVNPVTNKIFVANFGSGTVSKIDGGTNTVKKTISVGSEPSMIAVNPNSNKAYVTLHGEGKVAVIDGPGNVKVVDIYSAGPYGIAVDQVRNLVYVATINTFRIAVIDGGTDTFLGWAEIRRMPGEEPVPLRMIAVNPNIGTSGHIFATTAGVDGGWDKFLLLPKGWDEYFARAHALDLNEPREGIAFEPSTNRVFATSRGDDLVAAYLDGEPVCDTNFVMSSDYLVTVCVAGPGGSCVETYYR